MGDNWAEYAVVPACDLLPLPDDIPVDQAVRALGYDGQAVPLDYNSDLTLSMILPIWVDVSISSWAFTASAMGNVA